ncbi:MAG: dTDP-glucose 4,6-dehydratase [Anaerolineales bacterium]|nr:dTDP-glucose 4,6-dehydratase [Chloroflexota bacterium]MBL6980730.1 dTDP-glucose 4,6-dehydratase [Anaerolineales bacterium]
MQSVLVTGGAGFIGSNFVKYLLREESDVHVINLDALTYAGNLENLNDLPAPERHEFIKGNICDGPLVHRLLREYKIDTIVHFAAESHVDRSILGPSQFIQTNIVGTFTLLDEAKKFWVDEEAFSLADVRLHHISTDEVYGSLGPDDPPFSETTPYAPNSPYAASKASSDHLVRAYGHTYGMPISITNCSNNYGPLQYPEKLIPLMILNALTGKDLPIYGDGQQIRDWLLVEDHCEAILRVIKDGIPGETYNVGGGNQPTNIEIVELICSFLDELVPDSPHAPHISLIRHVADRPGHDRRYAIDNTKIRRELDWQPHDSLQSGLLKTVEWYLRNSNWVLMVLNNPTFKGWIDRNYSIGSLNE